MPRIVRQCLDRLEPGEIRGKVPGHQAPVAEEVYASIEAPEAARLRLQRHDKRYLQATVVHQPPPRLREGAPFSDLVGRPDRANKNTTWCSARWLATVKELDLPQGRPPRGEV